MKRLYEISAGMDIELTIEVDLDVLTPEMAKDMNSFWMGAEQVLEAANGDVIEAAVRRAAAALINHLHNGYNAKGAIAQMEEQEGFPAEGKHGMTLWGNFDIANTDPADLTVSVKEA